MKSNKLLLTIFIGSSCCLWNPGLAQTCLTGLTCWGTAISFLRTFDECCGPVFQDTTLARCFLSGSTCSPCYVLGLERASYTLTESNTVYSIRLRVLSPADPAGFTLGRPRLRLLGVPGTATENDFSYITSDIILRSFAGLNVSFTIPLDDTAGEPVENFIVTTQPPIISSPNDVLFLFRNSTINIRDTEKPTYQFLLTDHSQFEGRVSPCNGVTIMQTGPRVINHDVHLLVTPLTYAQYSARSATDPSLPPINTYHSNRPITPATYNSNGRKDFNNTVLKIVFPATSEDGSFQTAAIDMFDDFIDEYLEGFILVLDVDASRTFIGVDFSQSKRTSLVRIYDNDLFFFGFEQQQYTYNELLDEGIQEIPFSAAPGNETEKMFSFSLEINALQGTFQSGTLGDFSFGSTIQPVIRFSDGLITPFVINDNIIEGTEIGQVKILPSDVFKGHAPRFQSVRIVITDEDGVTLTIVAPSTVSESNGSFLATISLLSLVQDGLSTEFEVDIYETGITATLYFDFRLDAAPTVVFQHSSCCNRTVLYRVRDDNVAEPDEILTLTIRRSISSVHIPVLYRNQSVDVTIIDNDVARIGFTSTTISATEGNSATLSIAVLGNIRLGRNVIVRFSTTDISAIGGSDYANQIVNLTFNATATRHEVRIRIISDNASEKAEQFKAILHIVDDSCIKVNLNPSMATVTIPRHAG